MLKVVMLSAIMLSVIMLIVVMLSVVAPKIWHSPPHDKTEHFEKSQQWKRINHKQIARWQHLSRSKASAFLFEIFLIGVKKYNNLYLRLVTLSSG
jgi:hypothetical protein